MTRAVAAILAATLAAGCGGRRWLGAEIPASCRTDYAACSAWADVETRWRANLALDHDRALTAYVDQVARRLARASQLPLTPHVLIVDGTTGAAAADAGGLIFVRRDALAVLDSEAELAAMLSHELVHLVSHHVDQVVSDDQREQPDWIRGRVDDEALADERAVAILVRAGYPAPAMLDMLRALTALAERESPDEYAHDDQHPRLPERLARIAAVVAGLPPGGDARRADYLRHLDGMVLGTDPRGGAAVDGAWVAAEAGAAVTPAAAWTVSRNDLVLDARLADNTELEATTVSRPWARIIAGRLHGAHRSRAAGHGVVRGEMPADFTPPLERLDPTDALLEQALGSAWRPGAGSDVAIIDTGEATVVIATFGKSDSPLLDAALHALRRPTAHERAAVEPTRLRIRPAAITGARDDVVLATCADAAASKDLTPPDRRALAGDPVKCATPPRQPAAPRLASPPAPSPAPAAPPASTASPPPRR